jgi:hypothetical protein
MRRVDIKNRLARLEPKAKPVQPSVYLYLTVAPGIESPQPVHHLFGPPQEDMVLMSESELETWRKSVGK